MISNDTTGAPGNRLAHHGRGGELFVLFIVNVVLKILTLGVYHFWGKTRVRRYLWTQTSFDGERLEYTGTGLELFVGFLKAIVVLAGVILAFAILASLVPPVAAVLMIALYVLFPVLIGAAVYSAQRYKLTRTRLRGIRFGLAGSPWNHGLKTLGYGLLTALTLGLYTPFMRMKLAGHMLSNTRFGTEQFAFDGRGGDLFVRFLVTVLLTIPTFGLVWFWYRASEYRYTLSRLSAGKVRFEVTESDMSLALFFLGNALIFVLTLGLGLPWVVTRSLRHLGENLQVTGAIDYSRIRQAQEESQAVGEGFAEALDLGIV
ncbi:MAG TPA: YjgN family protein [Pseudomonadales bacterium]